MKRSVVVLAACVLTAAGCDEKLSDFAGPTPNLTPTFSAIQRDIFNAPDSAGRPACTSCHNAQFARGNGNLNLSGTAAYAQLVGVRSTGKASATRVIPGDPDASYLIHKVEGTPGIVGQRMPLNGPYLTSGQIAVIRRWIALGAQND
jgi:hypothetical protein